MIVTGLRLTDLRAIKRAEFHFRPGFNLIVGVNGVGKTSVLDALSICLSAVTKQVNELRGQIKGFSSDDIRSGAAGMIVECDVQIGERKHSYLLLKPRETSIPQKTKSGQFFGEPPSPVSGHDPDGRPLAVLFSINRTVPSGRGPRKSAAAGGVTAALSDALLERNLQLSEYVHWMESQESMRNENRARDRMLATCENAVRHFLSGYANLRAGNEGDHLQLWIDRDSMTIPVQKLSDGERGILAIVLDLTRRFAQANPDFTDPASETKAVVLIDEIELHLHPKWQRQIVHYLTETFPLCQFIATTHSPQVIGEVPREHIHIMSDSDVHPPPYSFGVDSSRVLEEIMDADPRTTEVKELLSKVSQVIGKERFDQARALVGQLVERLGHEDPEVIRLQTLLDFMEGE